MIRDIINRLKPDDLRVLKYAHNHELSQSINLPDGRFIGVNIKENPATVIIEQVGDWAYGMHKES